MSQSMKIAYCMLTLLLSLTVQSETVLATPIDPTINQSISPYEDLKSSREYPLMHPTLEMMEQWQGIHKTAFAAPLNMLLKSKLAASPGENFSLLPYLSYVPVERDQGWCGNCWAWAGTGVMEIDLAAKAGKLDRLSIQYLNSNYYNGTGSDWACCGGWLQDLARFYQTAGMTIPWSNTNASYQDSRRGCEDETNVPSASILQSPRYLLGTVEAESITTYGVGKETAIMNIKNVLQQGKAVWFGFFLPSDRDWTTNFIPFWSAQGENAVWQPDFACGHNWTDGAGHAVLLVGYNDTDPQNRYWLLLNSWGVTRQRPHGLFRMNMDMDYDCIYNSTEGDFYAFCWETLDIKYPPNTPATPSGPKVARPGMSCKYFTTSTDPERDKINYIFDWGDGKTTNSDPVDSGTEVSAHHSWSRPGKYSVRTRATDIWGFSSEWSKPTIVEVYRPKLLGYAMAGN